MMVGIGYLLGGGFELREGVPAIQGCLRGVKWTLSVLRTAVGNSSLFATWFQRSSRDGSARYVVIDTKWIYCCNIRRVINFIVKTSDCGAKWETNNQVAFNGIGLVIGGDYFSCVILSEHFSSGALSLISCVSGTYDSVSFRLCVVVVNVADIIRRYDGCWQELCSSVRYIYTYTHFAVIKTFCE